LFYCSLGPECDEIGIVEGRPIFVPSIVSGRNQAVGSSHRYCLDLGAGARLFEDPVDVVAQSVAGLIDIEQNLYEKPRSLASLSP